MRIEDWVDKLTAKDGRQHDGKYETLVCKAEAV